MPEACSDSGCTLLVSSVSPGFNINHF
jgi:hypothetical protein